MNERARNVTIYKVKFDIIIFDESKYLMCSYQMMCGVVGNVAQNYSHFLIVRSHAFFRVLFFSVNRHAYVNFHIGHNLLFTSNSTYSCVERFGLRHMIFTFGSISHRAVFAIFSEFSRHAVGMACARHLRKMSL